MNRIFREPLLLFLILGGGIFLLDGLRSWLFPPESDRLVEITSADISHLESVWVSRNGRSPTAKELSGMLNHHVREQILYREALRRGLDQNDIIVRRRLAKKMAFLLEGSDSEQSVTEAEIWQFFEQHRSRYERPGKLSFKHIYFNSEVRGGQPLNDVRNVLASLQNHDSGTADAIEKKLGDPFMLQTHFSNSSLESIRTIFGDSFAQSVYSLPLNQWQGPVQSAYGVHLVFLEDRKAPVLPEFAQVRDQVIQDYQAEQQKAASRRFYNDIKRRYQVEINDQETTELLNQAGLSIQ